ncbi:MAG: WD40 repeat domain-containing protein, partial [Planctomycetota bacterium]
MSKQGVVFEELERQKKMAKSLEMALGRQKRMSKRLIIALVAAGILLLSTVLATVLAMRARNSAQEHERIAGENASKATENAKIALARQLAAQAELTISQQPNLLQRGVLLAVESMRRYRSLEADQALRHGLAILARPVAVVSHGNVVDSVAFSPDGKYLATASTDRTMRVCKATTGEQICDDKTARVWDTNSSEEVQRMRHDDEVRSVAFGPDGKFVATACMDNTAQVWEATTGERIARMSHEQYVSSVAFSPDGKYLATASHDNTARVWDANSAKE